MGIKGLLKFLKSAERDVNIQSFRGKTVAVDGYCWLHRGAHSCLIELTMKNKKIEELPLIGFCMKRINLLRRNDIKPVVVFDGANLPMKADTEKERHERRQSCLSKGKALLKEGKEMEAKQCLRGSINVTPEMALAFIKVLRKENVDVVVAPYEADSQLAYLTKIGYVDLVITEDSDLLAFGCPKVLFKMDENGNGKLIEFENIGKGNKLLIGFTPESFRHMCILSGCDYLPSISGVGPSTAVKLMRKFNKDPFRVIKSLICKGGNKVPENYTANFIKADHAFLYQLVFDPTLQKQVRLNTPHDIDQCQLEHAGIEHSPSKQVGLARGNINPLTLANMDDYSPAKVY
jgi:exonuclease-1